MEKKKIHKKFMKKKMARPTKRAVGRERKDEVL
jgi:hypothetical protein